jgi:hypothetical protein
MFLSWYRQQSCTAGRAAFIADQSPVRRRFFGFSPPNYRQRTPTERINHTVLMRSRVRNRSWIVRAHTFTHHFHWPNFL